MPKNAEYDNWLKTDEAAELTVRITEYLDGVLSDHHGLAGLQAAPPPLGAALACWLRPLLGAALAC